MTFKNDLDTDISVFLDKDEFAEEFVFSRTGLTINGIFDNEFETVVDGVETTRPMALVKDSDITGIVQGDTMTRVSDSVVYNVTGVHPDGTGLTFVILSQD